jgi:hypothetical protein
MLLGVTALGTAAERNRAEIVRLLSNASPGTHAHMRRLDIRYRAAVDARVLADVSQMSLGLPPACALGLFGDALEEHQAATLSCARQ